MKLALPQGNVIDLPFAKTAAPLMVLMVLGMMLLPLPSLALDALFTFNIGASILVLLAAMNIRTFKDFIAFPTILLLTTLLRLSLNVASTRVVLISGHQGPDAAGKVIESFGHFLIGGNFAVGIIVFIIITVINFVVITKGAGRVAEVAARFALDSLPGKQMAIDADLNAGVIKDEEARKRRAEVGQEADFYGSMDGASKFVRGDAIAGIIILVINLIGGIIIGMAQHGLDFSKALQTYTILGIGDGLVAQVPALIISTAAGIVVTRVSTEEDFSGQLAQQFAGNSAALYLAAFILGILGVIPGMPNLAFLTFAAIFGGLGVLVAKRQAQAKAREARAAAAPPASEEIEWKDVPVIEPLCLELPYRLISLVDKGNDSDLIKRIRAIRKKFVGEVGFLIPSVHIRDNLQLPAETYRFLLYGAEIGRGQVIPDRLLAIPPGGQDPSLEGLRVVDPTFGIPAVWIYASQRDDATARGYTVVEPGVVVATHLDNLVRQYAADLLGRQETQDLLDHFKQRFPRLIEDTVPKVLTAATVQRLLRLLLEEGLPIRDLPTVLEVASDHPAKGGDPIEMLPAIRFALRRLIVQEAFGETNEFKVLGVHPDFERLIEQAIGAATIAPDGAIEPSLIRLFADEVGRGIDELDNLGLPTVIVCSNRVRTTLSKIARRARPQAVVIAMGELPPAAKLSFLRVLCAAAGN
jgi:flagellar biosynthesis protein FlhA